MLIVTFQGVQIRMWFCDHWNEKNWKGINPCSLSAFFNIFPRCQVSIWKQAFLMCFAHESFWNPFIWPYSQHQHSECRHKLCYTFTLSYACAATLIKKCYSKMLLQKSLLHKHYAHAALMQKLNCTKPYLCIWCPHFNHTHAALYYSVPSLH